MRKTDAIKRAYQAADKYCENLLNCNFLFLTSKNRVVETSFLKQHFKHLTGIITDLSANRFFDATVGRRLKESDIEFRKDGTTVLKLNSLSVLMDVKNFASLVGEYNPSLNNILLYTDILIGKSIYCMGFILDEKIDSYIPNTTLREDIEKLTDVTEKILCVFKKGNKVELYDEVYFLRTGLETKDILLPEEVREKVEQDVLEKFKL